MKSQQDFIPLIYFLFSTFSVLSFQFLLRQCKKDAKSFEREDGEIDTSADISTKDLKPEEPRFGETVNMNALDYEDGEENDDALGN